MKTPEQPQYGSASNLPEMWTMRLGMATAPEQIVQLANKFIEAIDEIERARLPSPCFPPQIASPQDVCSYAFRLTQEQLRFEGSLAAGLTLDRMELFFSHASSRIAQLAHISRIRV